MENQTNWEVVEKPKNKDRVTFTIDPELHRQLALKAAEEDISLNRLVSAKLSL